MKVYITYTQNNHRIAEFNNLQEFRNIFQHLKKTQPVTVRKTLYTKYDQSRFNNQTKLDFFDGMLRNHLRRYPSDKKMEHFNVFQIPKKSGGYRTITAPDDMLKAEYTVVKEYLENHLKMKHHQNAFAYTKKTSTLDAITQHKNNNSKWFLKIDIKDFFDTCSPELITRQLRKIAPFNLNIQIPHMLAEFATIDNKLPQGTPLSPIITNLIMIPFDHHFSEWCNAHGFIYTRYADDILISHQDSFEFSKVIKRMEHLLRKHEYPFEINTKKTRYGSRNGRNWNLGLMLNKDNKITLGHEYKNQCKVILHKLKNEELPKEDPHLMGLFSYLKQIEPTYYNGLNSYAIRKHGKSIKDLLK